MKRKRNKVQRKEEIDGGVLKDSETEGEKEIGKLTGGREAGGI